MKIIMIGNFEPSHSTENDWLYSYEQLGHEVVTFQEHTARTEEIYRVAKDADMVHYVHTHEWNTPGQYSVEELFNRLHARNIPTVSVHLDYWRGLVREKDVGQHPFWKTRYIFTADGGSNEWYREQGINHFYLKAGVVERECKLGDFKKAYEMDVIFTGSYGYHPEWSYRPKLIDWLASTYGDRFRRYAGDVPPHGNLRGQALNDAYASAKVAVGDTLCLDFKHPHYFSDRLFETTGRGGFLIFPFIEGIQDCFEIGKEIVTYPFGDFDELKRLIDYYVEHDEEREAIRLAGFERTKRDHTYTNRAQTVIDTVLEQEGQK